jgi:hypothetical protein
LLWRDRSADPSELAAADETAGSKPPAFQRCLGL